MPKSWMHSFTLCSMTLLAMLPTRDRFRMVQTISSVRYSVEFLAVVIEVADVVEEVATQAVAVIQVGAVIRAAVAAVHVDEETVEMIMNWRIVTFASWPTIPVVVNTAPRRSRI